MLLSAAGASAQGNVGGSGHASELFLAFGAVFVLAAFISWRSKSFSSFFPVLGGLLVLFVISILGVEQAVRFHWLRSDANRLVVAGALFACLLLGLASLSSFLKRKGPEA
jgi:hypothetical protein